jgi:CheY-like chemotaxis protein
MSTDLKYIIVDDDPFNNMICCMIIKRTLGEVDTKTFTVPEEGLIFIQKKYKFSLNHTILLLDINMPTLTGWEFLERYEKLSEKVKTQINIYLHSSSLNQIDRDKAKANKYVKDFISKPLNSETILSIAEKEF